MKVEGAVLGSPSLIVLNMFSVDVKLNTELPHLYRPKRWL